MLQDLFLMECDMIAVLCKGIQHKQAVSGKLDAILLQLRFFNMKLLHHRIQLLQLITFQIQQLSVLQPVEMLFPAIGTKNIQQLLLLNITTM